MKHRIVLLLCACILLCGCNENTGETITAETPPPVETTLSKLSVATVTAETADPPEEDKPFFASEEDKAAFELLGDYTAEHSTYPNRHVELHISGEDWELSEDYELFREYFFGTWEKDEPQSWETPFVIDDSESAFLAENCMSWFFMDFYKVGEDVLVFQVGSAAGGSLYWLDKNEPETLYGTDGAPGGSPNGIFSREDGFPGVWVLHKSDAAPSEPENNYLSVYRLREMAQKHGVDYGLLVDVELEAIPWARHDSRYYFYPMYLVSETDDRIEIKTQAGDPYSYAVDIGILLEKVDGEWARTVEFDDEALSALAMVGRQTEDGKVFFDIDLWTHSEDHDLFREYFFGTWEYVRQYGALSNFIIDDSEKSSLWSYSGFYKIDENVLAFTMWGNAEGRIFWLDINDPDRMYEAACAAIQLHQYQWIDHETAVLTKTDAPPNEPENNYLSDIRLREMSRDYGIDIQMLTWIICETDIEYKGKKIATTLDSEYCPIYLISESPDKLEFKTQVANSFEKLEIDTRYTIEKIGGEWVRTVEFDGDVRLR